MRKAIWIGALIGWVGGFAAGRTAAHVSVTSWWPLTFGFAYTLEDGRLRPDRARRLAERRSVRAEENGATRLASSIAGLTTPTVKIGGVGVKPMAGQENRYLSSARWEDLLTSVNARIGSEIYGFYIRQAVEEAGTLCRIELHVKHDKKLPVGEVWVDYLNVTCPGAERRP